MKTIFYMLLLCAAALAAIPFIPLHVAIDLLQLRRFGLEASQVEGNLWEGQLYDARLANTDLGNISTKLSLSDIAKGRVRLSMASGEDGIGGVDGAFGFGLGGLGIDDLSFTMPEIAGPPPVGNVRLSLKGVSARFPAGECSDARGEAVASLSGAAAAAGLPAELNGPAVCRDGKLVFDLASADGRSEEQITALALDKYRIHLQVKPANQVEVAALQAKGFRPDQDGYSYSEERSLGGGASPIASDTP